MKRNREAFEEFHTENVLCRDDVPISNTDNNINISEDNGRSS